MAIVAVLDQHRANLRLKERELGLVERLGLRRFAWLLLPQGRALPAGEDHQQQAQSNLALRYSSVHFVRSLLVIPADSEKERLLIVASSFKWVRSSYTESSCSAASKNV